MTTPPGPVPGCSASDLQCRYPYCFNVLNPFWSSSACSNVRTLSAEQSLINSFTSSAGAILIANVIVLLVVAYILKNGEPSDSDKYWWGAFIVLCVLTVAGLVCWIASKVATDPNAAHKWSKAAFGLTIPEGVVYVIIAIVFGVAMLMSTSGKQIERQW